MDLELEYVTDERQVQLIDSRLAALEESYFGAWMNMQEVNAVSTEPTGPGLTDYQAQMNDYKTRILALRADRDAIQGKPKKAPAPD